MTRSQFRILMVLTVLSGFLGGAVSNLLLRGAPALAAGTASQVQDVVRARKFALVDTDGKERARLSFDFGGPDLVLVDNAGRAHVHLGLMEGDYPFLALWAPTLVGGADLSVRADGGCDLELVDSSGSKVRASTRLAGDGGPNMELLDASGKLRAVVGCTQTVTKETGAQISYRESTLTLFKADGTVLWQAP